MVTQEQVRYSTAEDVKSLLKVDDKSLNDYCLQLPVRPRKDLKTGKSMFSQEDVDLLVKAKEWQSKGEDLKSLSGKMTKPKSLTSNLASKSDIAVVVEAVSQAKEGILADISKIIDEKLEGMDEIVVELIKCKGQCEAIKQKLNQLSDENEYLKAELSRFKPIKFGLYKKVN